MYELNFRAYIRHLDLIVAVQAINFIAKTIECYLISEDEGDLSEFNFGEVELLQFTGLRDCNDLAIYVGDIIGWHKKYTMIAGRVVESWGLTSDVHWTEDAGAVYVNTSAQEVTLGRVVRDCTVVGNVYQNPELI